MSEKSKALMFYLGKCFQSFILVQSQSGHHPLLAGYSMLCKFKYFQQIIKAIWAILPLTKRPAWPGKWKERLNKITVSDYNTEVVTVSDEFTKNLRKTICMSCQLVENLLEFSTNIQSFKITCCLCTCWCELNFY